MAKRRKNRKPYRGRDAALPPQTIRIEAKPKPKLAAWWEDNKQTVIIRLVQLTLLALGFGLVGLVWSLLS